MAEARIETPRLILRTEREGDFEDWIANVNTGAVREYLGGPEQPDAIRATFKKTAADEQRHGFSFRFIEERASGRLIGSCGLKRADADGMPAEIEGALEIGWLLREDAWGQGFASEAAQAMLAHAFDTLGEQRVIALTSRSNEASWRMMEKLGMIYRPEWDFVDPAFPPRDNPTIVYDISRETWETRL